MRQEQIICDECGAVRKEVNHWLVVLRSGNPPSIQIYEWPCNSMVEGAIHLCGQDCVHKQVNAFLSRPRSESA